MPDRVVSEKAVVSSTSGTTITFSPAFKEIAGVVFTGQNLSTGDYWAYTSTPTATGFSGVWKNSWGTAVVRTFDYIATGYGRVI
jgi:hypothetical protein